MVYEETFLRNFRFYAKTLTKSHDLTVSTFHNPIGVLPTACQLILCSLPAHAAPPPWPPPAAASIDQLIKQQTYRVDGGEGGGKYAHGISKVALSP
jgi:hypothetical protein